APSGSTVGIDMGIAPDLTDADGQAVANPRFIRLAEARRKRSQRRLSHRSVYHKQGKKPRTNHAARQRARQNQYPKDPAAPAIPDSAPTPPAPSTPSPQSRRHSSSATAVCAHTAAPVGDLGDGEAAGGAGVPASPAAARAVRPP